MDNVTNLYYTSTRLPIGKESEGYNVTIKVEISDMEGASHVDVLTVKVRF